MKLVTVTWLSPLLSKKLHWNTLRHAWDTIILLKSAYFKHFDAFSSYWNFWNNKICCKPLWICVKLVTVTRLSPLLSKKLHWNTLRHTWDTVILLKTAQNCLFQAVWAFCSYWNFWNDKFTANHWEHVWNWSQ